MGMFSTFVAWQVFYGMPHTGTAPWLVTAEAIGAGLLFAVVLGLVLELAVFRWVRNRPQVTKAVITIGVLLATIGNDYRYLLDCRIVSPAYTIRHRGALHRPDDPVETRVRPQTASRRGAGKSSERGGGESGKAEASRFALVREAR